MELIHSDLCGPMQTKSRGGNLYFIFLTNDCTRYTWVYFLQAKSEALHHFKAFRSLVEKQLDRPIKVLRIDKGGEFTSKELQLYYEDHGIRRQLTSPYSL